MEIDGLCEKRSEKPTWAVEFIIITGFMDSAKRADAINAPSSLKLQEKSRDECHGGCPLDG